MLTAMAEAPAPAAAVSAPHVAAHLQTFLAFDYGLRRTGVAVGNRLLRQATAQRSIHAQGDGRWTEVTRRLQDWQPDALVVGVPFHPDGAAHENTARARRFARQLAQRYKLPVFEVDERYSTVEAARHAGAREDIDSRSACVILEQFLRNLP